jgi:hypothetical protein
MNSLLGGIPEFVARVPPSWDEKFPYKHSIGMNIKNDVKYLTALYKSTLVTFFRVNLEIPLFLIFLVKPYQPRTVLLPWYNHMTTLPNVNGH